MGSAVTIEYYNFSSLTPAQKSCFLHFNTSACVRSSILFGLALLTAFLAVIRIIYLHYYRSAAIHHFLIHYSAVLLCLLCAVSWMLPGVEWLEYTIAWLMVVEYLIVFHKYWSIGRVVLSTWRMYFRSLFVFIVIIAILNTGILLFDLVISCALFPHCQRLHYLSLSCSEFMLACLTVLVAVNICKRFVGVSMTHAMRAAQKFELFVIAIGFLVSAIVCLVFDSVIFATEIRFEVGSDDSSTRNTSTRPPNLFTAESITSMHESNYSVAKNSQPELYCIELYTLTDQSVYDVIYVIEMIVRYLVPLWFALLIIRPRRALPTDYEEIGSINSAEDRIASANSAPVDYRAATSWRAESDRVDDKKRASGTDSNYQTFLPRSASSSTLGVPNSRGNQSEAESEDEVEADSPRQPYLVPARAYAPSSRDRSASGRFRARPEKNLVDDLRARHLSQAGTSEATTSTSVSTSTALSSPSTNTELPKPKRSGRSNTFSQ